MGRLGVRLRGLYAARLPAAVRERRRLAILRTTAGTLERRGLGRADDVLPPNNARLLGELAYSMDLDAFDALAPTDADVPEAVATLARTVLDARDPFAAVRALAARDPDTARLARPPSDA
jgi:hypothetical protein